MSRPDDISKSLKHRHWMKANERAQAEEGLAYTLGLIVLVGREFWDRLLHFDFGEFQQIVELTGFERELFAQRLFDQGAFLGGNMVVSAHHFDEQGGRGDLERLARSFVLRARVDELVEEALEGGNHGNPASGWSCDPGTAVGVQRTVATKTSIV